MPGFLGIGNFHVLRLLGTMSKIFFFQKHIFLSNQSFFKKKSSKVNSHSTVGYPFFVRFFTFLLLREKVLVGYRMHFFIRILSPYPHYVDCYTLIKNLHKNAISQAKLQTAKVLGVNKYSTV